MPRKPRFFLPGYAAHVVQRGNNRTAIFFEYEDYSTYLAALANSANRYGCDIHAYVLMTNHVHLLLTPETSDSIGSMMQYIGRKYVPFINKKYSRTGTLWEGRYRASTVCNRRYVLACYRYIEMNPVRAGMAESPGDYPWSSFRSNGLGGSAGLLTQHTEYAALGEDNDARAEKYRGFFRTTMSGEELESVRRCLQSGTPFGGSSSRCEVEALLGVKVGQPTRGRPHKQPEKGL
jgi:putative transposase